MKHAFTIALGLLSLLAPTVHLAASPTVETEADNHWFTPAPSHLVHMKTQNGDVIIMLSEDTAPKHLARFSNLVESGFYNGKSFYRVIEGFVAQGGSNNEKSSFAPLDAEFYRSSIPENVDIVEPDASHAPATGFLNGMPVGVDQQNDQFWHTHCPGTVAFARDTDKDTATTEFYIVIGQAPRHLDRNMSVIGRVIAGMEHLQRLPRGARENGGVINEPGKDSQIISASLGNSLPVHKQRSFRVQTARHPDFQQKVQNARTLTHAFFHNKPLTPRTIDVCYYQTEVEEITGN